MNTTSDKGYALFFDIDGTLVSFTTHRIPASTIDALTQAKARGARIFISTGRPYCIINNLGDIEHLIDGYITVNGAYCFAGGEEIGCHPLTDDVVRTMLDDARRHDYPCVISGERHMAVFNDKPVVHDVFGGQLAAALDYARDAEAMTHTERILQISPFVTADDEPRLMSLLPGCLSGRWHASFTDVTLAVANKGLGLLAVARHLGIDPARTMAFGDGGNDLTIIRHAGIGVAMGNAVPALREAADYVTLDVDSGGIAHALRHFGIL